jgi:hypothetical protein
VDSKRPPALTSPWKIGFLVSLLLIFLSVGVNYMIFRTFNLSWTSIGFDQGSVFFHRDQFLSELFPLVALVALASLIAYLSITTAVRRYKIYLDSGHDYRNLIRMIREATDLDDENVVAGLKKYPELREMLNSFRERNNEKEKLLAEREEQLVNHENNMISGEVLSRECEALVKALQEPSTGGQFDDLSLTIPDLASVEKAARSLAEPTAGGSRWGDENNEKFENLSREIRDANGYLRNRLEESTSELQSSCSSAQDLEKQLSELCGRSGDGTVSDAGDLSGGDLKVLHQMLDTIEKLSETLNDLGEEAKGVAINTALQAGSGEGALADLIQLAEDVRRVAIKFTDVAISFQETIEQMRKSVTEVETQLQSRIGDCGDGSNLGGSLKAIKGKLSLWVERIIILSDNFKNIEETVELSMSTIEEKLSVDHSKSPALEIDPAEMDVPQGVEIESSVGEDRSIDEFEVVASSGEMFGVHEKPETVFSDVEVPADKGIPGLENETGQIFSKPSEESEMFDDLSKARESEVESPAADHEIEDPEATFEELPPGKPERQEGGIDLPAEKSESLNADFAEETMVREFGPSEKPDQMPASVDEVLPEIPAEPEQIFDLDGPGRQPAEELSGIKDSTDHNAFTLDSPGTDLEPDILARPEGVEASGEEDEEEAIDLYALGAVDYAQ